MTAADRLDGVFDRYLAEVLVTEPSAVTSRRTADSVPLPNSGQSLSPQNLQWVLADPRALFTATTTSTRARFGMLLAFARSCVPQSTNPPELASRIARLRFFIWSFPARVGWPAARVVYTSSSRLPYGPSEEISESYILAEALAAQRDWKRFLDSWEDDPWLANRNAEDTDSFENDLRWLTITWPRTTPPEKHDVKWPTSPATLDLGSAGDHRRVAADTAERWLERSAFGRAATALAPGNGWRWLLLALYPVLAALVIAAALIGYGDLARFVACGLLGAGLVASVWVPPRFVPMGLLRVPAAAAVGLAVLLSLTSRWWISPNGAWIGGALLVGAAGYLMLESRQHGAQLRVAFVRGLVIMVLGGLHAAVLSVAVLGFLVPAMGEHGECLNGWWNHSAWHALPITAETTGLPAGPDSCAKTLRSDNAGAPAATLLLMTGWSLSLGLAAQVLWDDRPVTAPLGRLRRVRGGQP